MCASDEFGVASEKARVALDMDVLVLREVDPVPFGSSKD